MNRVIHRASAVLFLVIALVGGLVFFIYEYFTKAEQWIVSAGSPHIYNSSNIGCGQVYDRSGTILLDITESRTYAKDETVRRATLHWLGDRGGSISAILHVLMEVGAVYRTGKKGNAYLYRFCAPEA